jgi:sn-glycerol 3-phosphate transport system ATP-binding protein
MSTIQFKSIQKHYGSAKSGYHAIRGFNADIQSGEFVVIVGPSGCGKSTLLRMVAGLETISSGEIQIGDTVINHIDPAKRNVAMVFQNYALYPHMTARANMAYALRIAGLKGNEIELRVNKAAAILGLSNLLDRKPRELSGGQRQRVAMGRAIVRQPQVFLFDEPLSNLDAILRVQTRLEIQKLHRQIGVTTLFVTHDQVEAMTLANRVIVMNTGEIEQFDTPENVYSRPASLFVASFIGSPPMNLLTKLPGILPSRVLGVRPEHLEIESGGWPVHVETIELLGSERLIHCKLGSEAVIIRINSEKPTPKIGDVLSIRPMDGQTHWFDASTGKRVITP